jgi:hypothetical protein
MSRLEFSCNSMANKSEDLVAIVALPPIQRECDYCNFGLSLQALSLLDKFFIHTARNELEDPYLQKMPGISYQICRKRK